MHIFFSLYPPITPKPSPRLLVLLLALPAKRCALQREIIDKDTLRQADPPRLALLRLQQRVVVLRRPGRIVGEVRVDGAGGPGAAVERVRGLLAAARDPIRTDAAGPDPDPATDPGDGERSA